MRVILDTCVWTRFLRRGRPTHDPICAEVTKLIKDDAVQMLGSIRQELLSGAQPQGRFEQLKEYLRFYPNLALDERTTKTLPPATTFAVPKVSKVPPQTC